ncbi:Structural maintenance of chromosomes protein 1 [Metarhizium anisopliae]
MGKLIRLELFNFKSYKGHHTLLFGDSYFTSIIGPNGSGKSNSMDAISFVLGIKSSHLRSAHLKDLVYRGRVLKTSKINDDGSAETRDNNDVATTTGDDKASRGDPKTAWVMAVYEDDAGDEQRWKRSITSSGASEYRINDRVVTAQQYNEALETENILMKARNFLVFQGDVEAIASQSPQDLTRLIEQISGSLEYKTEYEKLQADAEEAAENQNFQLHRRRGINSEIKQYREQKKEADSFQKKTEERDAAIVSHCLWKLYHYQKAMDESSATIQDHQEDLKELKRNVETFEARLEDARRNQNTAGRLVARTEKEIKLRERNIEDKENALLPFDEKVHESSQQVEKLHVQSQKVTKERDEQAAIVEKVQKDIENVEKAQAVFEKDTKEQMKKQGRDISDTDRKEYNLLRAQVMSRSGTNQAKLENLERQRKADEVTVNNLRGKLDSITAAIEKAEAELQNIGERRSSTESASKEISDEIARKKKEFNQLQSERVRTNQKRTELEEKLEDVARKLREADDGRRQNDRETRMKEMVTSLKRMFPGVRGRIGDLCTPKQKKYDEAVIVALGKDFDSVVVDTEKVGVDCVQYLKEQRFPPMTFIPLDNIKVNAVNTAIKGFSGARLTIDTINFDTSVERAVSYACGSSVVCDSLSIAKHICYDKKIPVKAVTLEGYIIHKAGLMTGGRGPEPKGGKRKFEEVDVQNLQRMAMKLKDEIDRLPKSDRRGTQEESLQIDLAGLERRLVSMKDELAAFGMNWTSKKRELDGFKKELRDLEPKYKEQVSQLETDNATVSEFRAAIARVEDEVFANFCRKLGYSDIRAYDASQGKLEQEVSEKRNQFEVQKQRLENRLKWELTRHGDTETRIRRMQEHIRRLKQDIKTYSKEKADIEQAIRQDQDELEALQDTLEQQKADLADKNQKVSEARTELQKRSKDIEARQRDINTLETTVQKNSASKSALLRRCRLEQIQIPLVEGTLDNLPNEDDLLRQDPDAMDVDDDEEDMMDIALDDHGIAINFEGLDNDLKESDGPGVEEKLTERISLLASELEKLNPNMRAMERLESVESRLKQTDQEYEDSKTTAQAAKDAFAKIKQKRYDRFNKAFTHIQEQISHVYKDLTRSEAYPLGGQAYLDIEEDTDMPYLSGIKYHAMPPLKRFRDMEHLSGGEKTMAALALLFAIHSYQPSPFFVLDEVDAALDNANVDKIKKYIREHAGPGMQFIVISLKTGLFQDSESLVGVYRDQEVNSSRTLTLDVSQVFLSTTLHVLISCS